jgi:DNA adenine methylase
MSESSAKRVQLSETPRICKPFVKWAGGKSQLLGELLSRIPEEFERYFEPFVGGGALFFGLQPESAVLGDLNAELINTFRVVRDEPAELISALKRHTYVREHYYNIRNADRDPEFKNWSDVERAARVIYLNKSCFNGLYRVNSQGQFNTPFGRYSNPTICDERNILACSTALRGVQLTVSAFESLVDGAQKGDFVYFDPPYAPLSATSNYVGYVEGGFDLGMQERLYKCCVDLDKRGVKFLLSNSSAPFVLNLYKHFKVDLVSASRSVNSVASKRGKVQEVLVKNY